MVLHEHTDNGHICLNYLSIFNEAVQNLLSRSAEDHASAQLTETIYQIRIEQSTFQIRWQLSETQSFHFGMSPSECYISCFRASRLTQVAGAKQKELTMHFIDGNDLIRVIIGDADATDNEIQFIPNQSDGKRSFRSPRLNSHSSHFRTRDILNQ